MALAAGWSVWATVEGLRVRDGAQELQSSGRDLATAVQAQDWAEAEASGADLLVAARRTDDAASSPALGLAAYLPFVGDDVSAVRSVASSARALAEDGVVPLLDAVLRGEGPDAIVVDGRVDVALLSGLEPAATSAAATAAAADDELSDIEEGGLLGPVRRPVQQATEVVRAARGSLDGLATATRLLPEMLGRSGRRDYLLVFQNLAEARPTGGIFGAWATLSVEDGRAELVETGVNDGLGRLGLDVALIDPAVLQVYGPDVAKSQNMNLSADFPTAARLVSDLWVARGREMPDGVVSFDPVVLASILRATGPVDVAGGPTLNGRNAVRVLQSDAYRLLGGDEPAREAYLGAAVTAVFQRLVEQASLETFSAVAGPVRDGHVQVWSATPAEQEMLAEGPLAGSLPAPSAGTVGIYTTNTDASKLDHYITRTVRVQGGCGRAPGLVLAIDNDAPAQVPYYVAAKGPGAVLADPPTTHAVVVSVYLPPERGISSMSIDGQETAFSVDTERGWTLVRVPVQVAAGATAQVRVTLSGLDEAPRTVLVPPGVDDPPVLISACPN